VLTWHPPYESGLTGVKMLLVLTGCRVAAYCARRLAAGRPPGHR
jgi:hypothetical protein